MQRIPDFPGAQVTTFEERTPGEDDLHGRSEARVAGEGFAGELGLRGILTGPLRNIPPEPVDFFAGAPENWIGIGGKMGKAFRYFTERYPFIAHGLSLSIGSPAPLDIDFVKRVGKFLK